MGSAKRGPASAGEDLDRLASELGRKGWDARRLESLRAGWEAVCHDPMHRGRGGRSLPENMPDTQDDTEDGERQDPTVPWSGARYRLDPPTAPAPVNINCSERVHLCKAACCKLNFALTPGEVRSGKIKWDRSLPYLIAHNSKGYCAHIDGNLGCTIYEDRPALCRRYDCRADGRIWKDFENMIPNAEWIEENTSSPNRVILRDHLPLME
jgi:Fe-S-cluster containining protein